MQSGMDKVAAETPSTVNGFGAPGRPDRPPEAPPRERGPGARLHSDVRATNAIGAAAVVPLVSGPELGHVLNVGVAVEILGVRRLLRRRRRRLLRRLRLRRGRLQQLPLRPAAAAEPRAAPGLFAQGPLLEPIRPALLAVESRVRLVGLALLGALADGAVPLAAPLLLHVGPAPHVQEVGLAIKQHQPARGRQRAAELRWEPRRLERKLIAGHNDDVAAGLLPERRNKGEGRQAQRHGATDGPVAGKTRP
mmetsp:Transcript_82525/g.238445  ORF Transcript_82525/g.238445 Transcript_82525/m.238445 type:complete len:250 (-) Transcript_82525:75-824(-)